jgi:hypothetical protein
MVRAMDAKDVRVLTDVNVKDAGVINSCYARIGSSRGNSLFSRRRNLNGWCVHK